MPTTSSQSATRFVLALAALTLAATAGAQTYMQPQAAPIERSAAPSPQIDTPPARPQRSVTKTTQPAPGVWLSVSPHGSVAVVAASADRTELRVDSGIANVTVHHPAQNALILVDLGGGQVDLIKDGLYTFNADTKTARVLVGEADAFSTTDANSSSKPIKLKEDNALTFGAASLRAVEFAPFQARPDLLPRDTASAHGDPRPTPAPYYGYAPYYGGFYGDPYYAWGPYAGWDYPYGFYPGLGFGFGYYGGFGFGRGFYGGGFRGRR